jgi:hypothetical protein
MLKTLFIQTILAVHAIALTTAILIVVKPAVPQLRSLRPALSALVPGVLFEIPARGRPQLSRATP